MKLFRQMPGGKIFIAPLNPDLNAYLAEPGYRQLLLKTINQYLR